MGNSLEIKKGFTLMELMTVMVMMVVVLTMIIYNGTAFIKQAKFYATVREMDAIAQAAIDSYNSSSNVSNNLQWPSPNASNLGQPYLPQAVSLNPFGKSGSNYQLSFANNMVTVITMVPKGILIDSTQGPFLTVTSAGATQDQISISKSIPNGLTGRLSYELKYLYKQ